ncbi:MAG: recombinase family protein [Actinomyces sp.]|jgi:DNA invertase Pin-like site-specific DNA recombinase|nr:recombinase family protein [Actinomyces sp.]MCI1787430.1 recombinase family protein [Actinomyces sp.]MCI1830752.1 recombinase family protein [Actinomyces sp.]
MRAIVYTRQSMDAAGEGRAVARQAEDCLKLAESRGWDVVAQYEDNDISAAGKKTRPGFEKVLADLGAGRAGAVIAWNLDRLTRNRRDTVRLIETAQEAGAVISVVRGSDLDMSTPAGRMTADLLAAVARNEIEVKSDRQRRANEQRALAGEAPRNGRRPFGYTLGLTETVPTEAAMIRDAYAQLLAGGSLTSLARQWNASGALTSTGHRWKADTVRSVVAAPRNAALRRYRGEVVATGTWPAIVDEAQWHALVAILSDPSRSTSDDRAIKYLLPRIALCGKCGARMSTGSKARGQRTYKCLEHHHLAVKAQPIDDYVTAVIVARLARPDLADIVDPGPDIDVDALRTEANTLRARMAEAARMFADGTITGAQLARINGDVTARLEAVEAEMSEAGERDVLARFVDAGDVAEVWEGLDILTQREIVKALFESITIMSPGPGHPPFNPDNVVLEWRRGDD